MRDILSGIELVFLQFQTWQQVFGWQHRNVLDIDCGTEGMVINLEGKMEEKISARSYRDRWECNARQKRGTERGIKVEKPALRAFNSQWGCHVQWKCGKEIKESIFRAFGSRWLCHAQGKRRAREALCVFAMAVFCVLPLFGCGKEGMQQDADTAKGDRAKDTDTAKGDTSQDADTAKDADAAMAKGKEKVTLTVWGAEEDAGLMAQIIQSFESEYREQADFDIAYGVQGETTCKDVLLSGLEEGADVFAFADDQLNALAAAGALEPVENADAVRAEHLAKAVEAASVGDTVYAYPLTADNGYFLYYNKEFFTEEDVGSLERILEIAADNGKLFAMDWSSAWYVYAFFGNTGMEAGLNDDGITNFCTWNRQDGEINGVDVAQAMQTVAESPGFASKTDTEFMEGVQDGSVIAGVSGVWNAVAIQQTWGENTGAAKLPEYACGGRNVQMASFCGCKLIGVNAYSKYHGWAVKLAEWITNGQNQELRFEMRGQGPSNKKAEEAKQVQESEAIAALLAQSGYSHLQRIGGNFWEPVEEFAGNLLSGNGTGEDLQEQLDKMVEGVTAR